MSDVKKFNDMFQGTSQQDAQEFLRCILDKLHDELTYPRKYPDLNQILPNIPIQDEKLNRTKSVQLPQQTSSKSSNGTSKDTPRSSNPKAITTSSLSYASSRSSTSSRSLQSSENSSLVENTEITPARVTTPSIISDLFEGTLESRVRCLSCRKEYIKEDKFFDLSIPIDKKSKIIDDHDDKNGKDRDGGVLGSFVDSIGGWLRYDSKTCALRVHVQALRLC